MAIVFTCLPSAVVLIAVLFGQTSNVRMDHWLIDPSHLRLAQTRRALLESMPTSLKSEVAWLINSEWLGNVYFLRAAPRPFLVELALSLTAKVYPPGDAPPRDALYIIYSGFALYQGRILTKGGVFGIDMSI